MVRPELVQAFDDACYVVVREEVDELPRTLLSVASAHGERGMLVSSVHLQAIDSSAARACKQTAERLYTHLIDLLGAEPPDGSNEKAEELVRLLTGKIDSAGWQIRGLRDEAMERFGKSLGGNWSEGFKQMPQALDNARMMFAARLRTAALGSVNRGGYKVSNTVNMHGGTVGAVQAGAGSMANVTQTVHAAPPQPDILAALESIREAIVAAQAGDPTKHADELETVTALTVEAKKDTPNRIAVPALVNGLAGTAKLLAHMPGAFATLTAWGHAIGGAIPV